MVTLMFNISPIRLIMMLHYLKTLTIKYNYSNMETEVVKDIKDYWVHRVIKVPEETLGVLLLIIPFLVKDITQIFLMLT